MRLYMYSDGINSGFFANAKELQKGKIKGPVRPGKRLIDEDDAIPSGWRICSDDRSAIERIPTMRDLIRQLT